MTAPKQHYYESEGGCAATSHFPGWATSTFIEEEKCTRHDLECSHLGFPQENLQEMGVEHLLDPLFLFNPSCSSSSRSLLRGGDLEGGGSSGGRLQGEGGGAAKGGEKGGLAAKKREKGRGDH